MDLIVVSRTNENTEYLIIIVRQLLSLLQLLQIKALKYKCIITIIVVTSPNFVPAN